MYWEKIACLLAVFCLVNELAVVESFPARWARGVDDPQKSGDGGKGTKGGDRTKKDDPEELFEGDIVLTDQQITANNKSNARGANVQKRSLLSYSGDNPSLFWPNATVPYAFSSTIGAMERQFFMDAMDMIENCTCIEFIDRFDNHVDYLLLDFDMNHCMSNVGRIGGAQRVTLARSCSSVGNALHELGHALGLLHEHSRPDRDTYIMVMLENLKHPRYAIHFEKISQELFKTVPDVGYDIQSIMHYSKFAFAMTGGGIDKMTIIIKNDSGLEELQCLNRLKLGQRKQLSYKDKLRINALYKCADTVEKPPCVTPTPTPTATVASTTEEEVSTYTPMPVPSTTIPTATPLLPRLKTGNVLRLNIIELSLQNGRLIENRSDHHGMRCTPSPGCVPLQCLGYACRQDNNQFQIIKNDDKDTRRTIRGGNTVLLRSIGSYSHWLDCTDPTSCKISECRKDNNGDLNNASYISSCAKHRFRVYGVGRGGKVLNVNNSLQFLNIQQDSYLKCNNKTCGTSVTCRPFSSNCNCFTDRFKATKLYE